MGRTSPSLSTAVELTSSTATRVTLVLRSTGLLRTTRDKLSHPLNRTAWWCAITSPNVSESTSRQRSVSTSARFSQGLSPDLVLSPCSRRNRARMSGLRLIHIPMVLPRPTLMVEILQQLQHQRQVLPRLILATASLARQPQLQFHHPIPAHQAKASLPHQPQLQAPHLQFPIHQAKASLVPQPRLQAHHHQTNTPETVSVAAAVEFHQQVCQPAAEQEASSPSLLLLAQREGLRLSSRLILLRLVLLILALGRVGISCRE